jgi:putative ABC transport system permease protein
MNTITRGIRNAFRNGVRTLSIVIILGLSIGLSLTMLVAHQTVQKKINTVKSSIGNTITIAPAGFSSFSSVNNSLTTSELSKVSGLPHVTNLVETLTDRLTTIGATSTQPTFPGQSSSTSTNNQTSLTSPTTINTKNTGSGPQRHFFVSGGGTVPTSFTLPISITGTNDTTSLDGSALTIINGKAISGSSDTDNAMVSKKMAVKNNLKVGSTFTAYGTTLTVSGIFTVSGGGNSADTIVVSLPTEQSLSNQSGDVTSAIATVDSLSNLSSVTTAITNKLGSSTADVTSSVAQANTTLAPLNSVKSISLYSVIGAVIAGGVIILLTMVMIVRERRREIGVIKAIGASNARVIIQFMVEAVTFTILGSVIGLGIGVIGSSPVTKLLVNNSSTSTSTTTTTAGPSFRGGGGGGGGFTGAFRGNGAFNADRTIRNLNTVVGWDIILYGLAAAIIIAIIGSGIAAWMIAKVRPAEVMRTE